MATIQVRGVPDDVHARLRRRAAASGKSLQEYLLSRLVSEARTPTLEELFERVEQHTGGEVSLDEAVRAVRADRDER